MVIRKSGKFNIISYLLLTILLVMNISACSYEDIISNESSLTDKSDEKKDEIMESTVISFDLGNIEVEDSSYKIRGVIGVPNEGTNHPIVFIMHGANKKNQDMIESYHEGFSYLVDEVSKRGYITISLDVSDQYDGEYGKYNNYKKLQDIFDIHFHELGKSIEGLENNYGIDLKNKGDLSKVSIIAEGESAEGSYYIVNNYNISSLMLLSPIKTEMNDIGLKDLPTAIVIPQLDGVASNLDGQDIYDTLKNDEQRESWTSLVYLNKGNHNYFNTAFVNDDSLYVKEYKKEKIKNKDNEEEVMTPSEQRNFLINYSLDFLSTSLRDTPSGMAFTVDKKTESELYGVDVQTRLDVKEKVVLMKAKNGDVISDSFLFGYSKLSDIDVNLVRESCIPTDDTAGPFKQPGKPKSLHLFNIKWEKKDAKLQIKLPMWFENIFENAKSLNISMAIDSTDSLNNVMENQVMIITIYDKNGKSQKVELSEDQPALHYRNGELLLYDNIKVWSNYTPISDVRIPFSLFNNIGVDEIDNIIIEFNGTDSGSIMIEEVSIY